MATPIAFQVFPYSTDELARALSNEWVDAAATRRKRHFHYFAEYLGPSRDGLRAAAIVVEEPYLSQSFLDDYADYYARGFRDYPRQCKRVHFFRLGFSRADLLAALADPAVGHALWAAYLGYVVVKPLPSRQIGATLLLPYAATEANRRHYPVVRPYRVNLLGKQLEVASLIFQEQDNNVSACATTALWMAFHKTAGLFQTPLPSPYHITAAARNLFNHHGRNFPSVGLDQTQIGEAIQAVGLVAELRTYRQSWEEWDLGEGETVAQKMQEQLRGAQGFLYAYLRLGLPVLLFILLDEDARQGHLVTVTGYRLSGAPVPASAHFSLTSESLDRLYAHDDQMGPYARFGFTPDGRLTTPWPADANWDTAARWKTYRPASLYSIFVPLTAQIRITYEQVYRQVGLFEQLLTDTVQEADDVVWDIYLALSNDYKEDLRRQRPLTGEPLVNILTTELPKYVWVARASIGPVPILEMVFDATDLHTGFYCLLINVFTPLRASLGRALGRAAFRRQLLRAPGFDPRFLDLLLHGLPPPAGAARRAGPK